MKSIILSILALSLVSCATPEQNQRLSAIVDLALSVAERRGAITPEDAADVREAGTIVLDTKSESTITVTATK
jgi:hypothetical protein